MFGIVQLVQYFRLDPPQAAAGSLLTQGFLLLLAGAFCAFHSSWFLETFPVLATLYGAAILIVGVRKNPVRGGPVPPARGRVEGDGAQRGGLDSLRGPF